MKNEEQFSVNDLRATLLTLRETLAEQTTEFMRHRRLYRTAKDDVKEHSMHMENWHSRINITNQKIDDIQVTLETLKKAQKEKYKTTIRENSKREGAE